MVMVNLRVGGATVLMARVNGALFFYCLPSIFLLLYCLDFAWSECCHQVRSLVEHRVFLFKISMKRHQIEGQWEGFRKILEFKDTIHKKAHLWKRKISEKGGKSCTVYNNYIYTFPAPDHMFMTH